MFEIGQGYHWVSVDGEKTALRAGVNQVLTRAEATARFEARSSLTTLHLLASLAQHDNEDGAMLSVGILEFRGARAGVTKELAKRLRDKVPAENWRLRGTRRPTATPSLISVLQDTIREVRRFNHDIWPSNLLRTLALSDETEAYKLLAEAGINMQQLVEDSTPEWMHQTD